MKSFYICGLLLLTNVSGATEKSRPMSEMHGNCANYKTDLRKELTIWSQPAVAIAKGSAEVLPLEKKLSLGLSPQKNVQFLQAPEKAFPVKGLRYGGTFSFRPGSSGSVHIASGSKVWFDVVERSSNKIVDAEKFEMQTNCDKIFKIVTVPVSANSGYILQVSSSDKERVEFLLNPSVKNQ